jgi:hypothetical protein
VSGPGAEQFRTLADDFEAASGLEMEGEFPFRDDIRDTWRERAPTRS